MSRSFVIPKTNERIKIPFLEIQNFFGGLIFVSQAFPEDSQAQKYADLVKICKI